MKRKRRDFDHDRLDDDEIEGQNRKKSFTEDVNDTDESDYDDYEDADDWDFIYWGKE